MTNTEYRNVLPCRPLAPWIGGKRQLARTLVERIGTTPHNAYVEVFAGMAGVFLRRRRAPKTEVINDLNRDVATLFRVLQNHHQAFMDMLKWQLASRAEFERLMGLDPERLTDLQRAARFLYLQRSAFGGKVVGRTYGIAMGPARFDITKLAGMLADVHERLAGVWIECLPWQDVIARWDRPGTLFYLDPPYFGTEHYYGRSLFERGEYEAMAARLKALQGAFILTLNDHPEVRRIFAAFAVEPVQVTYTAAGSDRPRRAGELIITPGAE